MTDTTQAGKPADDQSETREIPVEEIDAAGAAPIDMVGQLIETFISPRDFASIEWLHQNVSSQPAGYHVTLGRIAGYATNGEERESSINVKAGEKKPPPSFWVHGQFESQSLATGEVKTAPWCILPRSAGELLKGAFQAGAERVLLDLEVGAQATGKALPYRWTVRAYGTASNEANKVLAMIKARQQARANAQEPHRLTHEPELPMEPVRTKATADRV